jgi:hypothetical protein
VGGELHAPPTLPLGRILNFSLNERLVGPRRSSGCFEEHVNLLSLPGNRSTVPRSFIPCPCLCIDRGIIAPWLEFCPFLYTGTNITSLTLKLQMCYRLLLFLFFEVVMVAVVVVIVVVVVVVAVG